jgi:hypothetical protein
MMELLEVEEDTLIHQEIMDGQVELETHHPQVHHKEIQEEQEVDLEIMVAEVEEQAGQAQEEEQEIMWEDQEEQVQVILFQDHQ